MTREIKFRFWNHKSKSFCFDRLIDSDGGIFKQSPAFDDYYCELTECDEVTALQYIGRKDINNKEIYNDFIVQCDLGIKYKVIFSNEWCAFMLIENKTDKQVIIYPEMQLEVIGNIHENPELI